MPVTSSLNTTAQAVTPSPATTVAAPLPSPLPTVLSTSTTAAVPTSQPAESQPADFVSIQAVISSVEYDIRYYNGNNFIGRQIEGYQASEALMTLMAVEALNKAAEKLYDQGYRLLIYDAYRPKQAVADFVRWTEDPKDIKNKQAYYPALDKSKLIELGYIARSSAHSRGSTVDLTLLKMNGQPVDMGSPFDFFGPISSHDTNLINATQLKNRNILRQAMKSSGFKEYQYEWWHYTLIKEPYPSTYFDFPVR